jgi:hypothetical protein
MALSLRAYLQYNFAENPAKPSDLRLMWASIKRDAVISYAFGL